MMDWQKKSTINTMDFGYVGGEIHNKLIRKKEYIGDWQIYNSAPKRQDTTYCVLHNQFFMSFGFGYETKIAGISESSKFHALVSEILAHTPRAASYCLPFNNQN